MDALGGVVGFVVLSIVTRDRGAGPGQPRLYEVVGVVGVVGAQRGQLRSGVWVCDEREICGHVDIRGQSPVFYDRAAKPQSFRFAQMALERARSVREAETHAGRHRGDVRAVVPAVRREGHL